MHTFVERFRRAIRSGPGQVMLLTAALALPLLVAIIALAQRTWYPVLDLAMTEFRLRDVGSRQTPLVGLPGRIGEFPDQGSHPGPINFWMLAPGYRLFGGSAWAMEASTAVVQTVWIGVALWIGRRRAGRTGLVVVAAVLAVLIRGYGLSVLTQPWNPYLPLIAWVVILLSVWSVIGGDHWMLVPLVVAASFAAQTHIPYLVMAGGVGIGAALLVAVRWVIARRERVDPTRPLALAVTAATFGALSLPIAVDQWRRSPGNVTRLLDHFGDPPEASIGLLGGVDLLLRHLNVFRVVGSLLVGTGGLVEIGQLEDSTWIPGALVLVAWIVAAVTTRQLSARSDRPDLTPLLHLHTVTAAVLGLGVLSMSRIFGATWFYLTLWAWTILLLVVVATVWSVVVWLGPSSRFERQRILTVGAVAIALCTIATSVAALGVDHPEEYLGETLGAVVEPTVQGLDADQRYVVFWTDAHSFGSQGFGLVSELERRGFDVGVYEAWRVPVTGPRVVTADDVDAEIIWATGSFVEVWRADSRVTELANVEPRSAAELAEFTEVRAALIDDLTTTGLDDLVPLVDTNLFGVRVDQRISPAALDAAKRLLELDQNAAVFLGPPGVSQ